ncbi:MAG: TonB-dependent receptor [Pseudomonadales bacterium]
MRYRITHLWRAVPVLVMALPAAPALSAEEHAAGRRIEEVIVTAERKEASIQDTSISISAFTGEFMEDFGIRNQEDLQNFVPATTIQPYDATVRGVGRNFRSLGGDPGVSTYMNGIYSEDLLTATAATFWDVERIEVLRGPQGTLYGRNAVGGAINILYKEPTDEFEAAVKGIVGEYGTAEGYAALSGPIIQDKLSARLTYAYRDRDGVIKEIGEGPDLDSIGTNAGAIQFRFTPIESVELNVRHNWMKTDKVFGGANGGGLVVLNEEGGRTRNTTELVPGYRFIDPNNTDPANVFQNDFYDASRPILEFTNPVTGATELAQANRAGIDYADFDGFQNAAASLTSFNNTSAEDAARYNACVFPGKISGDEICAATNGHNWEEFEQEGTQVNLSWDVTDTLQLKYLYGHSALSYERITDDDNTGSMIHDRQFYVNHEARYESHELQAFYDIGEDWSFTSGIFFYNASINQRGDLYSSLGEARMTDPYVDNTSLSAGAALIAAEGNQAIADALTGISASNLAFGSAPMVYLFSAKDSCKVANPAPSCAPNGGGNNLQVSKWYGDNGTNRELDVWHGPRTAASDLLYATRTEREAFAAYTQAVWDFSEDFTLTLGGRYAYDDITAAENLWRYSETGGDGFLALYGGLAAVNIVNGGLVSDGNGGYVPTPKATNGGIPFALSVYRPFHRKDEKWTYRVNLDWDINENAMMYFSTTTGYRSGGYNLLYFSQTPTYDPEELQAWEIGYKTQWLDDTLQVNGSFYYYDYENVHTVGTEVSQLGGLSTSVLAAPGAEIYGIEAEATWLATDNLSLGANFSWTPSEYTKSLYMKDPSGYTSPASLYPDYQEQVQNIKGNQLLQVPEGKATAWGSYRFPLSDGSNIELFGTYSWISKVYYSPFESKEEMADGYGRLDVRATYTSASGSWVGSAFCNNVFDDIGVLQVLREGEAEFFRHTAGTTTPRLCGLEVTYKTGNY